MSFKLISDATGHEFFEEDGIAGWKVVENIVGVARSEVDGGRGGSSGVVGHYVMAQDRKDGQGNTAKNHGKQIQEDTSQLSIFEI